MNLIQRIVLLLATKDDATHDCGRPACCSRTHDEMYFSYWGKAKPTTANGAQFHLLAYHALDVAAVGRGYLQRHLALCGWITAIGADVWLGEAGPDRIAGRHGFQAMGNLRVDGYRQHRIERRGQAPISLSTVDLSGTLSVTDAERFNRALLAGVGRAKAFGCGRLLVRRG